MITPNDLYRSLKRFFFDKNNTNTIGGHILVSDANTYDLGSVAKPFRNIYADSLVGTPTSVEGTILVNSDDTIDDYLENKLTVTAPLVSTITGIGNKVMSLTVGLGDGLQIVTNAIAVDTTVVRTSRSLTAGSGLTGGGDLSANRTFNVGAGAGVSVSTDTVAVNQAYSFNWTAEHTFNEDIQLSANLDFIGGARSITGNSNITVSPTGDLLLDPTGFILIPDAQELKTYTFQDLVTGIAGIRLWDRGSNFRQLTIGAVKVDELYARVFVADEVRIDRGEEYWSKSYGIVETDFILPAIGSTVDVWFEDSPGLLGASLFSVNDWLLFRTIDMEAGLVIQKVWFQVNSLLTNDDTLGAERQEWRITRKQGGITGNYIKKGSTALDSGLSGQGWIHLSALEQDGGPFIQIGDWDSAGGTKYPYEADAWTIHARFGNLNGTVDYAVDTYGIAAGDNLGTTPSTGFSGFTADATNGLRLFNTNLYLYDGIDMATSLTITYGLNFLNDDTEFANDLRNIAWLDDLADPGAANIVARIGTWGGASNRQLHAKIYGSDLAAIFLTAEGDGGSDTASFAVKAGGWDSVADGLIDITAAQTRIGWETYIGDGAKLLVGISTTYTADSVLHLVESNAEIGSAAGINVEQRGSGDSVVHYVLGLGQQFSIGIDNSDGDKFKISAGSALGSTDYIVIDPSTGSVTINGFASGTSSPSDLIAGDGLDLAGSTMSVDATVVRTSRTVNPGDGLTGGGNLGSNISLAVDTSVVRTTRSIISGAGLTGGTTLAADVTLAVGAGAGITVNANDVAVHLALASGLNLTSGLAIDDSIAGDGLLMTSKVLSINVGDGLDLITDALVIDVTDIIDTAYGLTESVNNIRINLAATSGLEFSTGALQIADTIAGGGLTIGSKVLAVNVGIGLDVVTDAVVVDVTDIINTSFGLSEDSNVIQINLAATSGLEFATGALQIADSIAGSGIGITDKILSITGGAGIDITDDGLLVDVTDIIDTSYGITESANKIRLNLYVDSGLEFTTGALRVNLDNSPGLILSSSGLKVLLATISGLEIDTNALRIDLDTEPGLVLGLGGLKILLNATASGLELTSGLALDDSIAGDGIGITSKVLSITAGNGITVTANGVEVNQAYGFSWTGNSAWAGTSAFNNDVTFSTGIFTFNTDPQINANLDFIGGARSITGSGNITIAPTGDLVLSPTGLNVLPTGSIQVDLGDYNRKFRVLYAAEMYADILVQQDVMSTIGGRVLITPTTTLIADLVNTDVTIDVKHNNLADGMFIIMEKTVSGTPQFEAMKIVSAATPITDGYRYSVTRNLDGTGANDWYAGDGVASQGKDVGDGYIDLASSATVYDDIGPTITVYARSATTNWNDILPVTTMGNLESFVDYGAAEFGFAAGNDLALDASSGFSGFTVDRQSGLRMFNTDIEMYSGATKVAKLTNEAGLAFALNTAAQTYSSVTWRDDIDSVTAARNMSVSAWSPAGQYLLVGQVSVQADALEDAQLQIMATSSDLATGGYLHLSTTGMYLSYTDGDPVFLMANPLSPGRMSIGNINNFAHVILSTLEVTEYNDANDSTVGLTITNTYPGADAAIHWNGEVAQEFGPAASVWSMGIDRSLSNSLVIANAADLNSVVRMVIDESGYVGILHTEPEYPIHVISPTSPIIASEGDGISGGVRIIGHRDNTSMNYLQFMGTRGTKASPTIPIDTDALGRIIGYGWSVAAAAWVSAAEIRFAIDGTPDSAGDTTDMPGSIIFYTTPEGSGTMVERMRIAENGYIGINDDTPTSLLDMTDAISAIGTSPIAVARFANSYNNVDVDPTVTFPILALSRYGKTSAAYNSQATFGIGRYEVSGTTARTQLDLRLSHGNVGYPETLVMTWLSSGNLGFSTADIEAWSTNYRAMQLASHASIMYGNGYSGLYLINSAYYDGSWKRRIADGGSFLSLGDESIALYPFGTGAIDSTFTPAAKMTVNLTGVGIGITPTTDLHQFAAEGTYHRFTDNYRSFDVAVSGYNFFINDATDSETYFLIDGNGNYMTVGSGNSLYIADTAAEVARITDTGLGVGITPAVKFHVQGEVRIQGAEATNAVLTLYGDQGDDAGDKWKIVAYPGDADTADFRIQSSWADEFRILVDAGVAALYCLGAYETTTAAATNMTVAATGGIMRSTSSIRFKENIRDLPDLFGLKLIRELRPVVFNSICKTDSKTDDFVGFIAEDIDALGARPFVFYDTNGKPEGVQYDRFTVVLTSAMQELDRQVKKLQARIAALESI